MKHLITKLKKWFKRNTKNDKFSNHFTKEELKDNIFLALEETGIIFTNEEIDKNTNIELSEYLFDSLQTILFLVCLEQNLGYEIPEELLINKNLNTINTLVDALFEANIK